MSGLAQDFSAIGTKEGQQCKATHQRARVGLLPMSRARAEMLLLVPRCSAELMSLCAGWVRAVPELAPFICHGELSQDAEPCPGDAKVIKPAHLQPLGQEQIGGFGGP